MPSLAPALLSTLAAPLLLAAGPVPTSAPTESPPAAPPATYKTWRPELVSSLARCNAPTDLAACSNADLKLQELIVISERPQQRLQHPRCLGSLSQLNTHLTVFRWGYQSRQHLQQQIDQALADCPEATTASLQPSFPNSNTVR